MIQPWRVTLSILILVAGLGIFVYGCVYQSIGWCAGGFLTFYTALNYPWTPSRKMNQLYYNNKQSNEP